MTEREYRQGGCDVFDPDGRWLFACATGAHAGNAVAELNRLAALRELPDEFAVEAGGDWEMTCDLTGKSGWVDTQFDWRFRRKAPSKPEVAPGQRWRATSAGAKPCDIIALVEHEDDPPLAVWRRKGTEVYGVTPVAAVASWTYLGETTDGE